ncbi:hypothetical protein P3T76_013118 [Phytophthora citrophthora]|uniref:Uncharacterized protein n=1 Tax=Phytophthora citrophthora TaxID=4793 RepID=A0AAD9G4K9_9STRA|nr:hypothetical protein P3T76_013118 [Phytophthora citrophthora]
MLKPAFKLLMPKDMSSSQDEPTTETAVDTTDGSLLDEEQRQEEKRWREELNNQRAEVGEAEETCVFLFEDLLAAIFEEMQVRTQNASLFATSARWMCALAFEAVEMSASEPADSLDRVPDEGSGRQQVLKLQDPQRCRSSSAESPQPLIFLRRLFHFLDKTSDRAELELQRFLPSEAISSLSSKRKLLIAGNGRERHEWCIPVEQIPTFLKELLAKGLVSVMPSTIDFVIAVNRETLDKKQAHMALSHLLQLVQNAVLTAEEQEQPSEPNKTDIPAPHSQIFQTEVKVTFPRVGPKQELLSSFLEEIPPQAIAIDYRAPGQVAKKSARSAANPSQRAISRKILLLMAPSPRQGSRWKTLRHRLIVPPTESKATTITAEADMEFNLGRSPGKLSSVDGWKPAGLPSESQETLDTAALSNIFALGTPRQLSAQELARRNDLLAHLEREAVRAQRRATTTVITSMSLNSPAKRENDGAVADQFQAYVSANSLVTTGIESGVLSPTRPQQRDAGTTRSRGRSTLQRSKFELERDSLTFAVSDGNAHVREETRLSTLCSPIKRPRASLDPTPPDTPGRPIQTASMFAHLPHLDSSRLAVGVSAVIRGIEKHGPRRNPSRKSRLQLHNYSAAFEDPDTNEYIGQVPFSPVRTNVTKGSPVGKEDAYRLPAIPVMSPIKPSPPKHVAFKFQPDVDSKRIPVTISPKAQIRQRPAKTKQPVWETKTQSPPRARNHHFASGKVFRKLQQFEDEERDNSFHQPLAPRRNVLPTSEYD